MKPIPFNEGWSFVCSKGGLFYNLERSRGHRPGPEPEAVTLPHDATVHEKRTGQGGGAWARGGYPSGAYIYEKTFFVPEQWAGKRVILEFEGAYRNAMVYLNGEYAGQCPNGYAAFAIVCNHRLVFGRENTVRVQVDCDEDSRWYAGAGLYRDANLYVAEPVHIVHNGIRLTAVQADSTVAALEAEVKVINEGFTNRDTEVITRFFDGEGKMVCEDRHPLHLGGGLQQTARMRLFIANPGLWSPEEPNCYRVEVTLWDRERVLDESVIETFGIRTLSLDPVRGFAVNGKSYKLNGGCIHHDNGILGAATFAAAEERRIRLLKAAGYNAIRMAHHPASRHLISACDRLGMLVMDELTDMWTDPKNFRDYGHDIAFRWEADVRDMVEKDYNHPSVVMYSLGNEIPESARPAGVEIYRMLGETVRRLDHTRYITAGHNSMLGDLAASNQAMGELQREYYGDINETMAALGVDQTKIMGHPLSQKANREALETLDIAGYNYSADRYRMDAGAFGHWISVGAETYPRDIGYNWQLVAENPDVIGDFVWTAFDYLGEAGVGAFHYRYPEKGKKEKDPSWVCGYASDFDIIGVKKPQGFYRQIVVGHRDAPYIAVQDPAHYEQEPMLYGWSWSTDVSCWNWPGYEGRPIRVEVYGRADEAELFVNGESLGRRCLPAYSQGEDYACRTVFEAVYQPGTVEAVIYKGGIPCGRYRLESTGPAVKADVRLLEGADLTFAEITLLDEEGRTVQHEDRTVQVDVQGAAMLQGLGSGDPRCTNNYFDPSCTTFHGHALAAVRRTGQGEAFVAVRAEGCAEVKVMLQE